MISDRSLKVKIIHLKIHSFGEKVYANGGLVGIIKAVIHEPERI